MWRRKHSSSRPRDIEDSSPYCAIVFGQIDGANWAEALTGIGTVLIAGGLIFAAYQVRESRKSRHADLAVEISRMWEDKRLVDCRMKVAKLSGSDALHDLYLARYKAKDPEVFVLQREPYFFEDLGTLLKMKSISLRWIDETLGGLTIERWNLWEPTVDRIRRGIDGPEWPRAYENFELLVRKLKKRRSGRRFLHWRITTNRS